MEYSIIRSDRKTVSIQIKPDGTVVVRAPRRMPTAQIRAFVCSKEAWIEKHLSAMAEDPLQRLTPEQVEQLREQARAVITERVAFFAPCVGVTYGRISIRTQHTRWGSCSSEGNLNFNCLLALAPPQVLDYVVVHELCHRRQMNHSDLFWAAVETVLPDYRQSKRWLKENGRKLMALLPDEKRPD